MKRHTSRSGNIMRALREVRGVNVFSFPDHVWKVKKPKGKGWKTRRKGTAAQIGKKFKAKTKRKPIKTKVTSFRIEPPRERERKRLEKYVRDSQERRKLEMIKQAKKDALAKKRNLKVVKAKPTKKHKIKPPKPRMKMTHLEKMHLLAQCKQFNVDPQEIDNTLTYYENKKHVQTMAKMKGYSETEITSVESEQRETVSQYQEYLSGLKGELEEAGYVVSEPNM